MKYNKSNIITDKDIIFTTSKDNSSTLGETLESQQSQIDELRSNIKWMYKYGALGSGAGGGGGSDSSSSFKVIIYKDETELIKSGSTLYYSSTGNYTFKVQILNGGTSAYQVDFYWDGTNKSLKNIVTANDGFSLSKTLSFSKNSTLNIMITNLDTGLPYTEGGSSVLSFNYVVEAYTFNAYYVYGSDVTSTEELERYNPIDNSIYMSQIRSRGLMLELNYTIAVNINEDASFIKYNDFEGNTHNFTGNNTGIHKGSGILHFPLAENIIEFLSNNENAAYKQISFETSITLESNINPEPSYKKTFKDNLIPNGLYLKVNSDGGTMIQYDSAKDMYNITNDIELEDRFIPGDIIFNITPYYNDQDKNRLYYADVRTYDVNEDGQADPTPTYEVLNLQLTDQEYSPAVVQIGDGGIKKVVFTLRLVNENITENYEYWINVRVFESNFNWYPSGIEPICQAYYRSGLACENIENIEKNELIENNINSKIKTLNFSTIHNTEGENISQINGLIDVLDFMSNIGIQYSQTNDFSVPIMSINASGSTESEIAADSIFIYQDKIVITSGKSQIRNNSVNVGATREEIEVFIPLSDILNRSTKSNYHLLSLYKRFENHEGNNYWKDIYVYIDGCLDGIGANFLAINKIYNSITIYPGNFVINTLDMSYWDHNPDNENKKYLDDNDVSCFWYTYNIRMRGEINTYDEDAIYLYNTFLSEFEYDKDNYIHYKSDATPSNIAQHINVPVMVLYFDDVNGNIGGGFSGRGKDNFKNFIDSQYKEDQVGIPEKVPVRVEYSPGKTDLVQINLANGDPAYFRIDIQGSSTRTFRCKNFELHAPEHNNKDNFVYIYSPNNDPSPDNDDAFLPEESFTLKADVVDSSHTNNNAIGAFVDENTKQFADASEGQRSMYISRLKNCLTGFPILLFLHTKYYGDDAKSEVFENRLFLGIYNFNLGRGSAFNMGYKRMNVLDDIISNSEKGFKIFELSVNDNEILPNVEVAEIQGNEAHFDFSQYDQSVLYQIESIKDKTYMWGDFVHNPQVINSNDLKDNIARFCERIAYSGGYLFKRINKVFSDSPLDRYGYSQKYSATDAQGNPLEQVPNFRYQYKRTVSETGQLLTEYVDTGEKNMDALFRNIINTIFDYENDDGRNIPSIDFRSLAEYYVICMAFGLIDSVQKNLNIKSWNGDDTKRWYTAFYDMDTALGSNNAGNKMKFYAFSDYWSSTIVKEGGKNVLTDVNIIRDWSPSTSVDASSFFDVPSSYLFAIAKYAYNILKIDIQGSNVVGAALAQMEENDPSNIWGMWRKSDGCLRNVEYFMQKYFDHHLEGIPEIVFNLNYRYKYMIKDDADSPKIYDNDQLGKFHGRKGGYVRYWLDGRIHILDGYFNVSDYADMITAEIAAPHVTHDMYRPNDNDDVYILREIFSNNLQGNQYHETIVKDITIKARPYTPIHIRVANNNYRYLFPDINESCRIHVAANGLQTVLYGGSPQWTDCESINTFITDNSAFSVKSKYLENIIGTANECKQWSINSVALKRLSLTSRNYTGTLKISPSADNDFNQYNNLTEVNISESQLNLEMNNVPVRVVKAQNKPGGDLLLTNLTSLEDVQIDGIFNRINIGAWKNGCSLPTNSALTLSCEEISITNDTIRFPKNSINITNNPTLVSLTISQFTEVNIQNCPKLKYIILDNCNDLESISVTMPQNREKAIILNINNNEDGIVDLSQYTKLKKVSFVNCPITKLILPANCNIDLPAGAFSQTSTLETIVTGENTKLYLTGPNTFQNCSNLDYTDIPIHVKMGTTSLAYSFSCYGVDKGMMEYKDVKAFFERIEEDIQEVTLGNGRVVQRPPTMYVTSIKDMFRNQSISYSKELGIQEYNKQKCSIKLSMFLRCFSLDDSLSNNDIDFLNRYMLCETNANGETYRLGHTLVDDYGYQTRKIMYINNFNNVFTTIDLLNDIIGDCIGLTCQSTTFAFVDNTGEELSDIKINDFFTAQNTKSNYISLISNFSVDTTASRTGHNVPIIFDFSELFNSPKYDSSMNDIVAGEYGDKWTAAATGIQLYKFMDGSYRVDSMNNINYLLSNCKLKDNVYASFGSFIPVNNVTEYNALDIYTFINWNNIGEVKALFHIPQIYNGQSHGASDGLSMKKFVTYEHMHEIIEAILNTTNLEYVGGLFNDCTVIMSNVNNEFTFIDKSKYDIIENTTLKSIAGLFTNMTISMGGINEDHPIIIKQDLMKPFKNVISFPRTFENWYFKYPLPFDFFNKRYETYEVMNNYCGRIEDGQRIGTNVIKYEYKYNANIIDIQECFANVKFEKARAFKIDGIYDGYDIFGDVEKPKRNRFTYVENGETKTTDHVYSPNGTVISIDPSYEIIDAEEAETSGYSIENYNGANVMIGETSQFIKNISSDYIDASGCFISPDFLYGVSRVAYFQDAISRTYTYIGTPYYTFTGTIPKHLMKNMMNISFGTLFSGLNITPIHMPEFDNLDEGVKYYVYVPEGFSNCEDFSGAFNFNTIIPSHDKGYIEFFALMTDKSLPNMQRLSNSTFNTRYDIEGSLLGGSQILATVYIDDSYIRYNLMISHDANTIYYGIDAVKFPYMRYDFILNAWQSFIYYGHLILNDNNGWNISKLYSNGSYVFAPSPIDSLFNNILYISKNLKLNAKPGNDRYINTNSSVTIYINKSSLINCVDPADWQEEYGDRFVIVTE